MNDVFEKNINIIKKRFPYIYEKLVDVIPDKSYLKVEKSKYGDYDVPVFMDGKSVHSKYSHVNESSKMFSGNEETVLFCGIGGGFHIQYFLDHSSNQTALICEISYASLKCLLCLCDLFNILSCERSVLLPPVTSNDFISCFIQNYIPILMGSLTVKVLNVWKNYFLNYDINILNEKIEIALNSIKQDVSTQGKFGKIWMRNIMLNLKIASENKISFPKVDNTKIAVILGAGPSLDNAMMQIKEKREKLVLFASDASLKPLIENKITPDFFISIDPQIACSTHCIFSFSNKIIAVFDLAASPLLVRQFFKNGNDIIFTISNHPFSQYISMFSAFPKLDVGGGTVAIAALNVALSLGFTRFEYAGLDFAYTNGKSYARGTYLFNIYQKDVSRLKPEETLFTNLIFNSNTEKEKIGNKITYKTKLLDSYGNAFYNDERKINDWKKEDFSQFPYETFKQKLIHDLEFSHSKLKMVFLPFMTWQNIHKDILKIKKDDSFHSIDLVLRKILML